MPSLNPVVAAPKVLLLGVFGGTIQLGTATLLIGTTLYRLRNRPLDERGAIGVLNAETFATYVGFGTGGLAVVLTVAFFLLGLGGEATIGWYVATMDGANPFAPSGTPVTVARVAAGGLAGSLGVVAASGYLRARLAGLGS